MTKTDELIQAYKEAQLQIEQEIEKKPKGSEQEYKETLQQKITRILAKLHILTANWTQKNVPILYEDYAQSTYDNVKLQFKAVDRQMPNMSKQTDIDKAAIYTAQANANRYLFDAIEQTRAHMTTEIRQAAINATETAIIKGQHTQVMQDNLKEMLKTKGIESVPYIRKGQTVYMQLDAYAELVARTTEHEIRNTANINLNSRIGNDLVHMSQHWGSCPICAPYQGRVYSISGTSPYYPYLYDTPWSSIYQNFHPRCRHVLTPYIEELKSPEEIARMRRYSNRSYDIGGQGWTKEQTEAANKSLESYRAGQERKRKLYNDRRQYERYKAILGNDAPKTFAVFRKIKIQNGERWNALQLEYRDIQAQILYNSSFDDIINKKGMLSDYQAREWYKAHLANIPSQIDKSLSLEDQARQACDLRNQYRTQTRELMGDQEKRMELDRNRPNKTFEELLEHKMKNKNITREEALKDIITTASKSNEKVNRQIEKERK